MNEKREKSTFWSFSASENETFLSVSRPLFPTPPGSMQVSLKKSVFHSYLHENKYFSDFFNNITYGIYDHPEKIMEVKVCYSFRYKANSIS